MVGKQIMSFAWAVWKKNETFAAALYKVPYAGFGSILRKSAVLFLVKRKVEVY